jgi:CRISPR-associated protein Cmr1
VKSSTYTLELLTPCFCAGANQAKAEIRAPSIRGQLRWWFRALGGTSSDERSIFGGVAGTASSSSIILRVHDVQPGPVWNPPRVDPNSADSYVWYFASASAEGTRWTQQAAIAPRSTFNLIFLQQRVLAPALQSQLNEALSCFLQLGSIGLRATRGLGSFICREEPFQNATLEMLKSKGFFSELRSTPLADTAAIAREIGGLVKGTRKSQQMKAEQPSPFGSSSPRQTSAIYFRPVRLTPKASDCGLVVFEAPHSRVLGRQSDRPRVIGHDPSRLTKPTVGPRRW